MKKIVAIGGGTGLSTLLRGLRNYPVEITAIVTMTDDGSSSGKLRKLTGVLPPGDVRKCIAALSENESGLIELFEHRYRVGLGLKGHSVGNLLIAALMEMTGSFELAVEKMSEILDIKGRVLPATLDDVHLSALFDDDKKIIGEVKLQKYGYKHRIEKVFLTHEADTNPKAIGAIAEADIILIGPGSLYTSVIPNFLHAELAVAVADAKAYRIYICNVSTERGETTDFTAAEHLTELKKYKVPADAILLNSRKFPRDTGDGFVCPVDEGEIRGDISKIYADTVSDQNYLYHSSEKLAQAVYKIVTNLRRFENSKNKGKVYDLGK